MRFRGVENGEPPFDALPCKMNKSNSVTRQAREIIGDTENWRVKYYDASRCVSMDGITISSNLFKC